MRYLFLKMSPPFFLSSFQTITFASPDFLLNCKMQASILYNFCQNIEPLIRSLTVGLFKQDQFEIRTMLRLAWVSEVVLGRSDIATMFTSHDLTSVLRGNKVYFTAQVSNLNSKLETPQQPVLATFDSITWIQQTNVFFKQNSLNMYTSREGATVLFNRGRVHQ